MKRISSNFKQKKHIFPLLFSLAILFDSNAQTDPCFTGQALPACYGCTWSMTPSITALEPCVVIEWEAFPDNPNTTTDDNDINSYQIYISQKSNNDNWSTYSLLGETGSLFYTASGLATNANYRLVVCVSKLSLLNVCPAGAYVSNAVDFTTPTNPVGSCEVGSCDAPYSFPQAITARSTTLRWNLNPQTTSYQWFVKNQAAIAS